jgi:hypothetical protein
MVSSGMRSYFKLYLKDSVFYSNLGEVPDQNPDLILASLIPHKGNWAQMLNYNAHTYVTFNYFGNDPTQGVPLLSTNLGSFLFFEDYSRHPEN